MSPRMEPVWLPRSIAATSWCCARSASSLGLPDCGSNLRLPPRSWSRVSPHGSGHGQYQAPQLRSVDRLWTTLRGHRRHSLRSNRTRSGSIECWRVVVSRLSVGRRYSASLERGRQTNYSSTWETAASGCAGSSSSQPGCGSACRTARTLGRASPPPSQHFRNEYLPHKFVMAGLVPAIHVLDVSRGAQDVDARAARGHDGEAYPP